MRKILLVLSLIIPTLALAETSQEKGHAIMKQQDDKNSGFKDYTTTMAMTLRSAQGEETVRNLHAGGFEVANDGDKSYMIFDKPADVRGTAILTHSHVKNDDQWLFLPAVKRVKRLNSSNKSGPFMGSEFAYEDLSSPILEKYSYNFLREEKCGDMSCYVIERMPRYENSGYTKQIVWVDTKELRTLKIDYYDRKNELLKTLNNTGFKLYLKKFWRAETGTMVNHQTKKSTVLVSKDFVFGKGLKPSEFEPDALESMH
jgi:outer membrane lipoprotein-sorting protein